MIDPVQALDGLGRSLGAWLGPITVGTGLVLVAAWAADRLLERRMRAAWRIVLFAAVGVRLFLPVGWRSPFGLLSWSTTGTVTADERGFQIGGVVGATSGAGQRWFALLGAVYLLVALGLFARWALRRWMLARALRAASPAPPEWEARAGGCPVQVHPTLGPLVAGALRPRIILPEKLLSGGDPTLIASIFRHETAHVRRGDGLLMAAVDLLSFAVWPVIPVWIAASRVRALVESACDEQALAGADASERRRYGETLLALADPHGIELAFGSRVGDRIRALQWRNRWPAALQLACAGALVAAFVTCAGEPSDESAPPLTPPPVRIDVTPEETQPRGSLDKEIIHRIVKRHIGELKTCYEQQLQHKPDLGGRVTVEFMIAKTGRVTASRLQESTMKNSSVETCIVQAIRGWEFPKPEGDGVVIVSYPFTFTPG